MAPTLHDNLRGKVSGRKTRDGWQELRIGHTIKGVEGSGPELLDNALQASGLQRLGDLHPTIQGLVVDEALPDARGGGVVDVTLTYRRPEFTRPGLGHSTGAGKTVRVGTALRSVQTNRDANGKIMFVEYAGQKKGLTMSRLMPTSTLVVEWSQNHSPGLMSRKYVGKTNTAGGFDFAEGEAKENTWLCMRIEGVCSDGEWWDCIGEWEYDEDDWDSEGAWLDANHACIPDGVIMADGSVAPEHADAVKTFKNYKRVNFNEIK